MITKSYEIEKNPSNFLKYKLFLLYGENNGLKKDIKASIKKSLRQKNSSLEIFTFYGDNILENEENFYNSIFSESLFSNKKIITINSASDKITQQIEDIIDKCSENTLILILAEALDKKSKLRKLFETNSKTLCIPCYPDNERDLSIIANIEFKKNNISFSKELINLLVEKANNDRGNLKNEIEKIKLFTLDKKNLEIDELKSIINFSGEIKTDSFINNCLCGNILQYKKILSEMYMNTVNQIFFLRILSNKLQRLLKMKEVENDYKNIDSLLSASKPPIFWKEKSMVKEQLLIWETKELKSAINRTNNTELLCKKNPQISKVVFFNFFNELCKKANSYS